MTHGARFGRITRPGCQEARCERIAGASGIEHVCYGVGGHLDEPHRVAGDCDHCRGIRALLHHRHGGDRLGCQPQHLGLIAVGKEHDRLQSFDTGAASSMPNASSTETEEASMVTAMSRSWAHPIKVWR